MKPNKLQLNPLIILLIIAAFAIGFLYSRVQNLEKKTPNTIKIKQDNVNNSAGKKQPREAEIGDVEKVTKDDHVRGNLKTAKVALIEYSDLECPFCSRFHETAKQAIEEYGDDFIWVYRHFPLDQLHKQTRTEAIATECVAELGGNNAFWTMVDSIFATSQGNDSLDLDTLPDLAVKANVNKAQFSTCLKERRYADKVESQYQSGLKAGVTGTPGNILINLKTGEKEFLPGAIPLATLKSSIDKLLSK